MPQKNQLYISNICIKRTSKSILLSQIFDKIDFQVSCPKWRDSLKDECPFRNSDIVRSKDSLIFQVLTIMTET